MLEISVGGEELWDEENNVFVPGESIATIQLEHSLVSVSKWESKWESPFLDPKGKTPEQLLDYIKFMIVGPEPAPEVLLKAAEQRHSEIQTYINSKMTAFTVYRQKNSKTSAEIVTSELIYYWMIALGIPFECQTWHLNRLLALIEMCNAKNSPPKKMSRAERAQMQRDLNAKRRAELGTAG